MSFFEKSSGILGINARNLLYLSRYNSRESKRFADDKLYTKNYLSSRGLSVPKLYLMIKNYQELSQIDPKSLPESFVIKPNHGFGGQGIVIIKKRKGNRFIDVDGNYFSWKFLHNHIASILDGRYAVSGLYDHALIEELLETHKAFSHLVDKGLPDIRIIVFNYVPVIAMLRLPTPDSHGKANLQAGALGIGINIANGAATYAIKKHDFISKLPNGEKISNIQIPDWNEILLLAAKAQHISQIKFMGVDIALTNTGAKILELNARAGLKVQLANRVLLKNRLKKVDDLVVSSPEAGVEVAKTLFGANLGTQKKEKDLKKISIGLYENITLLNTKYKDILAKIDPHADEVFVDESLGDIAQDTNSLDILIAGQRLRLPVKKTNLGNVDHKAVVGGKYLTNFIIDPNINRAKKNIAVEKKDNKPSIDEKIIVSIDKKLSVLAKKINSLSYVSPLNLKQQKDAFLKNPTFSPRFFYRQPTIDLQKIIQELSSFPKEIDHPLAPLYLGKIDHLKNLVKLIDAINTPDLQMVSEKLYGAVDKVLYDKASAGLRQEVIEEDSSKELSFKQVTKKIEKFLATNSLSRWKIKINDNRAARVSINKAGFFMIRDGVAMTENDLRGVLIHEVATHIFRQENGLLQPYSLFSQGTSNYLATEEGLAIYNQKRLGIPLGIRSSNFFLRIVAIYLADQMSFKNLFHYLQEHYGLDDDRAWLACLRAKRGLIDTSQKVAFTRDTIYYRGYLAVSKFLKQQGEEVGLKKLYIGKIAIEDLPYLGDLEQYKVRHLPKYDFEI